ncbi:TolC family protein [Sulfurimonas sp.]
MKNIMVSLCLSAVLSAQSFDTFLQKALNNSPYLKANILEIDKSELYGELLQRYKNPTLSLELSRFELSRGRSDNGYRTAITQPLRLWGVGNDKENLAYANKSERKSFVAFNRALFIKKLSLLYLEYVQNSALTTLAKQELEISKKILHISKERYKEGTIAKVKYLVTKIDLQRVQNLYNEQRAKKISTYYKLLSFAGENEELSLDEDYLFKRASHLTYNNSAELHYMKKRVQKQKAQAKLNTNKIEWVNLYAEYENEPDQDIYRAGVNIPLALFNAKKEEYSIAKLQAKQSEYRVQSNEINLSLELKRILKELRVLEELKVSMNELYQSQKELLHMYEEGYKIANIKLVELQNIKSRMIQTKEKSIEIMKNIQTNIVQYNYAVGAYNE